MLSLAKLGRGSEAYYLDAVAKGAEDYYVGRGEAPGYWAGRGAELLGLDGEVTPEALRAILAGTAPDGSTLGAANRTVPGFDLTFSAASGGEYDPKKLKPPPPLANAGGGQRLGSRIWVGRVPV